MSRTSTVQKRSSSAPSPAIWRGIAPLAALLAVAWALLQSPFSPIPGRDASALTAFAGEHPFRPIGTPVWGILIWVIAHSGFQIVPAALTVQALFAGLSAASLVWLARRTPFYRSRDWHSVALDQWGQLAAAAAAALYFLATPSFGLTYAFPRPESISASLLLAGLASGAAHLARGGLARLTLSLALLSLSAADHAAAALIAPLVLIAALLRCYALRESYARVVFAALGAALIGAAVIALGLAVYLHSPAAEWRELTSVRESLRLFWADYMARGPRAIPRVGWLLIALFAFLPLVLLTMRKADRESMNPGKAAFLFAALPAIAALPLFNLPGAPLRVAHTESPMPFVHAVMALWVGRLSGYIFLLLAPSTSTPRLDTIRRLGPRFAQALWMAAIAGLLGYAAASQRPREEAQAARTAMRLADLATAQLPSNSWVLTTGELDDYLLLARRGGARAFELLNVRAASRRPYQRFLASRDPWFDPAWIQYVGFEPALLEWTARAAEEGRPIQALAALDLIAPAGHAFRPAHATYALMEAAAPNEPDETAVRTLEPLAPALARQTPELSYFCDWFNAYMARLANEIGVEWQQAGEPDRARAAFDRAIAFNATNPAPHINRLLLAQATGGTPDPEHVEAARNALEPLVGSRGGLRFQLAYGRVAVQPGSSSAVFPAERDGAAEAESPFDRYARLAAEGRDAEARAELEAALQADPNNMAALQAHGAMMLRLRQYDAARADLAALQRLGFSPIGAQLLDAQIQVDEGKYDEAIAQLRALTLRPAPPPDAFLWLAKALDRAGREEEWQNTLPDVHRVAERFPPALHYLAESAARNRDYARARLYWQRAAELDPGDSAALEYLLRLDFTEQKADAMAEHAAAMLRVRPNHPMAWYGLATAAALQEDWARAARAYEVLARQGKSLEVLNDWGWCLYKLGRAEEALEKLRAAAEINPSVPRPWATMGLIELERGRAAEAVTHLTRAMQHGARGVDLLEKLEQALVEAAEPEKASRVRSFIEAARRTQPPAP